MAVECRLSRNFSTKEIFEEKEEYIAALKWVWHNIDLRFKPQVNPRIRNNRPRTKYLFGSLPPFNMQVKTNSGKVFWGLLRKHFPKSPELSKVFNRNTVKLSYSCTDNLSNIIKKQNAKNMDISAQKSSENNILCNCRNKSDCLFNGVCFERGV